MHNWVEKFVFCRHLIECEIEFLKEWENLLLLWQLFIVFRKLRAVELNKLVAREVELAQTSDGAERSHESIWVD